MNMDTSIMLHTGGIKTVISIPAIYLSAVLWKLTYCHPHVFVVDQADLHVNGKVNLGVSEHGFKCVQETIAELEAFK